MARNRSHAVTFGDFCFRQVHAGLSPQAVRRKLFDEAQDAIRRSMRQGVTSRRQKSTWSWLQPLQAAETS
jgi:hypothetical protein